MEFSEIENAFSSGEEESIRTVAYRIECMKDIENLKLIANRLSEFLNLYVPYKANNKVPIYQTHFLDYSAHILTVIANGNCRCKIYKSAMNNDILNQKRLGFVEITEKKINTNDYVTEYQCTCVFCNAKFYVEEGASGFGTHCKWSNIS